MPLLQGLGDAGHGGAAMPQAGRKLPWHWALDFGATAVLFLVGLPSLSRWSSETGSWGAVVPVNLLMLLVPLLVLSIFLAVADRRCTVLPRVVAQLAVLCALAIPVILTVGSKADRYRREQVWANAYKTVAALKDYR